MPAPQVLVVHLQAPLLVDEQTARFDVTCGLAVERRPAMICGTVKFGFALSIKLMTPETMGVEKLVPTRLK
jgi:hypothetical protein